MTVRASHANRRPSFDLSSAPARAAEAHPVAAAPRHPAPPWLGLAALSLSALIVVWAALALLVPSANLVIDTQHLARNFGLSAALMRFFGAGALLVVALDDERGRLRWVAVPCLLLGLSALIFEYALPALYDYRAFNAAIYTSLTIRLIAGIVLVAGIMLPHPPPLQAREMGAILAATIALGAAMDHLAPYLPRLTDTDRWNLMTDAGFSPFRDLSVWYWAVGGLTFALLAYAVGGWAHHHAGSPGFGWILISLILLAGAQLHSTFWPGEYTPAFTSSKVIALGFGLVLAIGGLLDLRGIALERRRLLLAEQERVAHLADLAVLKGDLTAMAAHEMSSPLAAIRNLALMIEMDALDPPARQQAIAAIAAEATALQALVKDVGDAGILEREELVIHPRATPLAALVETALNFAQGLPGEHPFEPPTAPPLSVWADPNRIAQVLRNLLGNAAKYAAPGTPIALRFDVGAERVEVSVVDQGTGSRRPISSASSKKFDRGTQSATREIAGTGLGLYIARRIVMAHGSDLRVTSEPGAGSAFRFSLDIVR